MSNDNEEKLVLSGRELSSLTPEMLEKLRREHGVTVNLTSPKPGLARILSNLTGITHTAATDYDRGFDRSNPGYDKMYDRDRSSLDPAIKIENPATLMGR